jgi:hypothetical protein
MDVHQFYWVVWFLLIAPAILLVIGWAGYFRHRAGVRPAQLLPLLSASISIAWLLLSFKLPFVLGVSYSHWRFAIIDGNFILMLISSIAAFNNRAELKIPVGTACVLTTILWSFIGAMNASV